MRPLWIIWDLTYIQNKKIANFCMITSWRKIFAKCCWNLFTQKNLWVKYKCIFHATCYPCIFRKSNWLKHQNIKINTVKNDYKNYIIFFIRPKSIELETGVADKKRKMGLPEPKVSEKNWIRYFRKPAFLSEKPVFMFFRGRHENN